MRSDRSDTAPALPPLQPQTFIERPMSVIEYYHASIGSHPRTHERAREGVFVLEGDSTLTPQQWQAALDAVTAAHPETRMRLYGRRRKTYWRSDAPPPRLRFIDDCSWDGQSEQGSEFIYEPPMSLYDGFSIELSIARRRSGGVFVILRLHHAVMDGSGVLLFIKELFRALRGEALQPCNAAFSDTQLMASLGIRRSDSKHIKTSWLTGAPRGSERGDTWRRVALGPPQSQLLPRIAAAMAEFAHRHSPLPALIMVPVDLRRHLQGLHSTGNYASMLLVPLQPGDGPQQFRERLQAMLAQRMEAAWRPQADWLRALPFTWVDRLLSRTDRNYQRQRPMETAAISNLGRCDTAEYSAPGFTLRGMFGVPWPGSAFSVLVGVEDRVELITGMPRTLASEGRLDAFIDFLRNRLAVPPAAG